MNAWIDVADNGAGVVTLWGFIDFTTTSGFTTRLRVRTDRFERHPYLLLRVVLKRMLNRLECAI